MRIVAIIQARTGSTRLPAKVLLDLAGKPMLTRVVERVRRAASVDEVVVATSTLPGDDRIADLCRATGVACERGSEDDVLDRYYRAATAQRADAVVRITSDCPLIDPAVVDAVVAAFGEAEPPVDYASNLFPDRTYPRGLDTEVMSMNALTRSWEEERDPALREHVTQHIQRHPERFRFVCVRSEADASASRWTVDTPEDFELVRRVFAHFGDVAFAWGEVAALLSENPDWADLNRHVEQKPV